MVAEAVRISGTLENSSFLATLITKTGLFKRIKMILFQIVDVGNFKNISPFAKNDVRGYSEMEIHIINKLICLWLTALNHAPSRSALFYNNSLHKWPYTFSGPTLNSFVIQWDKGRLFI